jgi:3'-phosphoadenosine 5'-phosphosulfate sulfotransferase
LISDAKGTVSPCPDPLNFYYGKKEKEGNEKNREEDWKKNYEEKQKGKQKIKKIKRAKINENVQVPQD